MHVIGLTGGIASGKSTVTAFFKDRDVPVIDADILGHRTYDPGTDTFAAVVDAFGNEVVAADGTIDRRVVGGKVFGKPEELRKLREKRAVVLGIQRVLMLELRDEQLQEHFLAQRGRSARGQRVVGRP